MSSLRILTYNTQCRSWGMEALAQGRLDPVTSTDERARAISRRILASPRTWDVVCLNEVFDEDAREVFLAELGAEFPNQIQKCDVDYLGVQLGIVGGAAALIAIPGIGWLAGLGIAVAGIAELASTKYEDSGLMLFSRSPFLHDSAPPSLAPFLQAMGLPTTSIPRVAFVPYEDAADEDRFAAKGVLYAGIDHQGQAVHVLASHTQSDPTDDVGKNADIRRKQFAQVGTLLDAMLPSPSDSEVILCGDFNIDGTHYSTGLREEWRALFGSPGSRFHDQLVDDWYREQSPGDASFGGTPLPTPFDRGATAADQRLDYLLRTAPPFDGRLISQHLAIPYEVAQDPDPTQATVYTSDHMPLSLDLHSAHPRGSVMFAQPVPFPDTPVYPPVDPSLSGVVQERSMDWFRIDTPGGYGMRLEDGFGRVGFEVYTGDNLSVPHAPFSLLTDPPGFDMPYGIRFALPSAPFYIRVFLLPGIEESSYRLRIHQFLGTGPADAIPLLRGQTTAFTPKDGAPHSLDDPSTPWDETDSVWFVAAFDTRDDGSLTVSSTITLSGDGDRVGLLVLSQEPGAPRQLVDQQGAGQEPVLGRNEYRRPATGFFLAQRDTGAPFPALEFTIRLDSDVTYLYSSPAVAPLVPGSQPRPTRATRLAELFCVDETDGTFGNEWGSDDIQINVSSGGENILHIPNTDYLEFDDDTRRNLPQLDGLRYVGDAKFELVELDDLSPVDRAAVTIPPYAAVRADPDLLVEPGNGSTLTAKFRIIFDEDDDGIYELTINLSQEPPPAAP